MTRRAKDVERPERESARDGFWQDLGDAEDAANAGLSRLTDELSDVAPSSDLRAQILRDAAPETRLERYAPAVAALLDIEVPRAKEELARLDDPSAWVDVMPGVSLAFVAGGPRVVGSLRGFVRVRAGVEFPQHDHLGEEVTMVMQGYYTDSSTGEVFGPGDAPRMSADTSHSFRVLADGPDLLGCVVAHVGMRALGQEFLAR